MGVDQLLGRLRLHLGIRLLFQEQGLGFDVLGFNLGIGGVGDGGGGGDGDGLHGGGVICLFLLLKNMFIILKAY